ncbi:MAG: DUF4129 domain-containing protein [Nitriliruptoraceae bacterium]
MPLLVAGGGLGHDADLVRRLAEGIVGNPPYRDGEAGSLQRLLQSVIDGVGGFLSQLFGAVGGTPALAWGVATVGLMVLGVVVWRATRGATLGHGGDPALPTPGPERSAASWRAEAEAHLAAGRREAALRARYAAAVVTLLERGVIDDVPGRTIRELDAELRTVAPALAPAVAVAGSRVERVVFGDEPVRDDDLRAAEHALERAANGTARVDLGVGV